MKQNSTVKHLAVAGVIAALYCALTLLLPFMTFGPVQCRFSEALTILPVFTPAAIPGLMVGCLVSNAVGLATGANVAGGWDLLIGTFATTAAAVLSYLLRNVRLWKLPVLSTLPPVILNGVLIGLELTLVLYTEFSWGMLLFNMLTVSLGQAVACIAGGLLLYSGAQRSKLFERIE